MTLSKRDQEKLREELTSGLIKRSSNNEFTLGPIFVEVKTTAVSDPVSVNEEDFFELSLPEAAFAREMGWRFHVMRVYCDRMGQRPPVFRHYANLPGSLLSQSLSLYVGPSKN